MLKSLEALLAKPATSMLHINFKLALATLLCLVIAASNHPSQGGMWFNQSNNFIVTRIMNHFDFIIFTLRPNTRIN